MKKIGNWKPETACGVERDRAKEKLIQNQVELESSKVKYCSGCARQYIKLTLVYIDCGHFICSDCLHKDAPKRCYDCGCIIDSFHKFVIDHQTGKKTIQCIPM